MDEQWTVVFGSLSEGIYRIVTGFESEEEAQDFLDDDGDDGFVYEVEVYEPEEDEDDYDYDDEEEGE